MGLDKEYGEAREFLTTFQDSMMGSKYLSWFECIIRLLGGFMSTYYLTGDPLYLENAKELGDRLLPAFHNDTAGIPNGFIGLGNGQSYNGKWLSGKYLIAEIGTNQLEFYALSRETGDMKYAEASAKPLIEIHKKYPDKGLLPAYFSQSGTIVKPELYSTGAMVDSYLEYLIKVWVQAGEHKEQMTHDTGRRWEKAMDEMLKYLVKRNKAATYLSDVNGPLEGGLINSYLEMNHLSCFAPGMLALGAYKGEKIYSSAKRKEYLATAEELMRTCYGMYHETKTGLGGEIYAFFADKMAVKDRANRLRPEAVESLMILHRVTGKDQYREWGWEMFQAFEDHCKIESGYSGLIDVTHEVPDLDNKQQTWFLAETLKYFYLLFSPEDVISLDQWVFNTEAHPMMIWS
jgi:mannosyl-oligosaccharide alpha-1,2-mannosidase